MKSIEDFLIEEGKDRSSNRTEAVEEVVNAIKKTLDRYDVSTRKFIWEKITSSKGLELMDKIVKNPKTFLSNSEFTKLVQKR